MSGADRKELEHKMAERQAKIEEFKSTLTPEQIKVYRKHFELFDLNGDGVISARELRKVSRQNMRSQTHTGHSLDKCMSRGRWVIVSTTRKLMLVDCVFVQLSLASISYFPILYLKVTST